MSLAAGAEITLTIEKPVSGGRMLARHDGQVVLVAGAIPGEHVRARVERTSKQVAFADTIEVLAPSADRRAGVVDWWCGGSLYAHIAYDRQLTLKSDVIHDAFARIAKMPLAPAVGVMGSREDGYRMRARLHGAQGRLGFFREGTHELCDAGATNQLLPETLASLKRLTEVVGPTEILSCELVENSTADQRAVLLEVEVEPQQVDAIQGITGLLFASPESARLAVSYGSPFVVDRIPFAGRDLVLTHHVQSFFQGNRYLLAHLVERVVRHVPSGRVVDLYAGVGFFAVAMASGDRSVVAVEGDRSSARDLDSNTAASGGEVRAEHLSVEQYLETHSAERPDAIVLDPPRTGVSGEAMSGLLALRTPRVVYLSCDVATLARDVKRLAEVGYRLEHIEAFDLFPNTAHIETLVVLDRT